MEETQKMNEAINNLLDVEVGDTIEIDTEARDEIEVHIVDEDTVRANPPSEYGVPDTGQLALYGEIGDEAYEALDVGTNSISIMANERRPDNWRDLDAAVYNPDVDDGTVVKDGYLNLGEVTGVRELKEAA